MAAELKPMNRAVPLLLGLLAAVFLVFSMGAAALADSTETVVIKQDNVALFNGQGTGYPIIATIAAGETVTVLKETASWAQVEKADGTTGWIPEALIKLDCGSSGSATGTPAGSSQPAPAAGGSSTSSVPAPSQASSSPADGSGNTVTIKQSAVDLFAGPATSYRIVTRVGSGTVLTVTGNCGSWDKVMLSDGTTGWIPDALVKLDRAGSGSATSTPVTPSQVAAGAADIRSGPGLGYSVLTTVSQGTVMAVQGKSADWYEVKTPGGILGWVADWLTVPATGAASPPSGSSASNIPAPSQAPSSPADGSGNTVTIKQSAVDLFAGPGNSYPIVTQVGSGTVLTLTGNCGSWDKVMLPNGTAGWLSSALVAIDQSGEVSRGTVQSAGAPYAGKGVWCSIYSSIPDAADLSRFVQAGVTHIYMEVATSKSGFSDTWKNSLDILLPAAHRAGIKVIAWIYTDFSNISADAALTSQVANFTTPLGDRPDGVAADIEELPQNNTASAGQMVDEYASLAKSGMPSGMPFIAITYPPRYRPAYPYAAMARDFSAIALMDYWHVSTNGYTYADAASFVQNSVSQLRSAAGNSIPVEVILQGYDAGAGLPSPQEMEGAMDAASCACGYSVYTWETMNSQLWSVFAGHS